MAGGEARFFGRYYSLTLDGPDGASETFQTEQGKAAMDIKFHVNYARMQYCREGEISILGLSHKRIHKYLRLAALGKGLALKKMLHVKLIAGYQSSAFEVFNGWVTYASVTAPPQMWLNLKIAEFNPMGGYKHNIPPLNSPKTLRNEVISILKICSEGEGIKFEFRDFTDGAICSTKKISSHAAYTGKTLKEVIAAMNNDFCADVVFTLRGTAINAYDKGKDKAGPGEITMDKDHGLLSVTGIDAVNGCVTSFLQQQDPRLSVFRLQSELNQQANGTYVLLRVEHSGHYNGQEWYTKYYCSGRKKKK